MNYHYDACDEVCPLPLVKLRVLLKKMKFGDSCRLLIKDTGSKSDIPRLLDKLNYPYTSSVDDNGIQELNIRVR
ncbi:sulfurtransferase TusA family protein [Thalassotalea euphylliae]|uniref:Sulfurtransferase TusA family protein n=1 Tax=Thalassotalea euphylliae TaxID=1655234 RepID=A0A3E0TQD6_9GAMM|nr:sulfurtransferase TusA family protein [Thalassotalea euphylliae]REL26734.1 sulfurtransferase TusA family protein [Thalassotalea euphylliae]